MTKVTSGPTISIDGFMAGLNMTEAKPFGDMSIDQLMGWMFKEPEENKNERAYIASEPGAYIMGRNMFGPIRGPWGDSDWKGWCRNAEIGRTAPGARRIG